MTTTTNPLTVVRNDEFCVCGYRESTHTDGWHPVPHGSDPRDHSVNRGKFIRSQAFNEAELMHERHREQLELDTAS